MNAVEFAQQDYVQWVKIENNMNIMLYLGDLFERMMKDVELALAEKRYSSVEFGMKHDLKGLLDTMMDLTMQSASVAKEAGNEADTFELRANKAGQGMV